jgi:chemotaxis protein CheZ
MQQYIGFKLNDNEFTIPILKVKEIINTPAITQLPKSPEFMKGIINLRGKIIPIVDLKELVNMRGAAPEGQVEGGKIIVVTKGRNLFGVLVDSITSVINIDAADIEPPDNFINSNLDRVEGVAKFDDRLVILLDTNKLVDVEDLPGAVPDEDLLTARGVKLPEPVGMGAEPVGPLVMEAPAPAAASVAAPPPPPPRPAPAQAAPPPLARKVADTSAMSFKELQTAHDFLADRFGDDEGKNRFLKGLVNLMDAMASKEFDRADELISEMLTHTDSTLYQQIGMVTRKLHNSLKDFRNALDPRIRQIADEDVPAAVDSLEFVIKKTEEAANSTMNIVEKYHTGLLDFQMRMEKIKKPEEFIQYLNDFRDTLSDDLMEIMITQEFQDITGQTIRKVITLVNSIEAELVGLIATFGVKPEPDMPGQAESHEAEKMTQGDVEDLLKEFGF